MDFTVNIKADALAEAINNLAAALKAGAKAEQVITAAKATAKKAEQKAEEVVAKAAAPKSVSPAGSVSEDVESTSTTAPQSSAPTAAAKEEKVSVEVVRARLADLSRTGKGTEVVAVLSKYGAKSVSSLAEEHYAAVMSECADL